MAKSLWHLSSSAMKYSQVCTFVQCIYVMSIGKIVPIESSYALEEILIILEAE